MRILCVCISIYTHQPEHVWHSWSRVIPRFYKNDKETTRKNEDSSLSKAPLVFTLVQLTSDGWFDMPRPSHTFSHTTALDGMTLKIVDGRLSCLYQGNELSPAPYVATVTAIYRKRRLFSSVGAASSKGQPR